MGDYYNSEKLIDLENEVALLKQERDSLQNRLTAEREGIEEFKGMMNKAFEDMESQLSEARAHCERLRIALFQVSTCGLRRNGFFDKDLGKLIDGALEETPAQSLAEIIAQAFMAGQADCGVDPSYSSAMEYAYSLRQHAKEDDEPSCMYDEYDEVDTDEI